MSSLSHLLANLETDFHQKKYLSSDPLEFVHRYSDPWDQEAVALLAALLAYGNVKQIRRSVEDALQRMAKVARGPALFVRGLETEEGLGQAKQAFKGFVHRFNVGSDLVLLFRLLGASWKEHGSMGAQFVSGLNAEDADITSALNSLIGLWREAAELLDRRGATGSFSYLLTAPVDGSCCKRWCMFLRWMGRRDSIDPGLWAEDGEMSATFKGGPFLRPSQLVIPLDTHTGRISQYLELTERKTLNWKAALEVTAALRVCDPLDPVRYDFALARLGILDLCQRKYRREICEQCQLVTACRFARRKGR